MPSCGWRLSDVQVASVLTYIRNSWGNAASVVSVDQHKTAIADLSHIDWLPANPLSGVLLLH